MFAGFNLDLSSNFNSNYSKVINFNNYIIIGENHLNKQKENCKRVLEEYIINGATDGTKLQDEWFPQVNADIFISHSHKDIELAQGLAGWLHEIFKLNCFIDSNVWGYSDDLLEIINSRYSDKREDNNGGYLYNHNKCNTASKHVNIMLSIALQKMIDKTEATFVINTDNCINKYGDIYTNETYSPWIYTEIACTELVRKKPLLEYRKEFISLAEEKKVYNSNESEYSAAYKVSLEHLETIDTNTLSMWENSKIKCQYPLDKLYLITHPKQMKEVARIYKENNKFIFLG